jgi:hypothetical protein
MFTKFNDDGLSMMEAMAEFDRIVGPVGPNYNQETLDLQHDAHAWEIEALEMRLRAAGVEKIQAIEVVDYGHQFIAHGYDWLDANPHELPDLPF